MPDTNLKTRFPRFPAALLEYAEAIAKDAKPEVRDAMLAKLDKAHERYAALDEKRESNERAGLEALAGFRRDEFPAIEKAVESADKTDIDFNDA